MFTAKKEILSDRVNRYKIYQNDIQLTYNQVIDLLKRQRCLILPIKIFNIRQIS